jgi:hypothetical protein
VSAPTVGLGGPELAVELAQITDADVPAVADFLHAHLNSRVPASAWVHAMSVPWKVEAPNHGFMIRDGQRVAGVHLAFYSERVIAEQMERFCNLGAWCVLPEFRFHSVRLLKALLRQDGYQFTDLSPSGNVVPLNIRLGFRPLDTSTALIPNLPWPTLPRRTRISADPNVIESTLAGTELETYLDHARAAAAQHLVTVRGAPLTRYLLARHRVLATLAELRIVGARPRPSVMLSSPRPKMYRSARLEPEQIDDLYSELVCVPW